MNDIQIQIQNVTLAEIGTNPNTYPEEVVAAGFEVIKDMEAQLKFYKQNITANIISRMSHDNATKLKFINTRGEERTLTLKKGSMKLNPDIKDPALFITRAGFDPSMLGELVYQVHPWNKIKEIRKQGGDIQILCDELYKEGQPGLTID